VTELQQNRYDRLLRRVGGLIGAKSMVNDALGELFPTIDVENIPAELLLLAGTRIAGTSVNNGAVAAVNRQAQVFNPVGSQNILTVTRVTVFSGTAQIINYGLASTLLATAVINPRFRDGRMGGTQVPVGLHFVDSLVSGAPSTYRQPVNGTDAVAIVDENSLVVCPPGFGFQVSTTTVNTDLVWTVFWRERVAQTSELNF